MRLFLGLDVQRLELDLKKLKINLKKGKNLEHEWVPDKVRHIPVCSVGEINQDEFSKLDQLIENIIKDFVPFNLKFEGVYAFPDSDQARLLWVGVQNSKELRELHSQLNHEILKLSPIELNEGPYKPHLPIVRLRNHREVSDLLSPHKNSDFGKVLIDKLVVYDMVAGGAFPKYRVVKEYLFNNPN